jgi:hypothetical protein
MVTSPSWCHVAEEKKSNNPKSLLMQMRFYFDHKDTADVLHGFHPDGQWWVLGRPGLALPSKKSCQHIIYTDSQYSTSLKRFGLINITECDSTFLSLMRVTLETQGRSRNLVKGGPLSMHAVGTLIRVVLPQKILKSRCSEMRFQANLDDIKSLMRLTNMPHQFYGQGNYYW